jgi:hypothetical protein
MFVCGRSASKRRSFSQHRLARHQDKEQQTCSCARKAIAEKCMKEEEISLHHKQIFQLRLYYVMHEPQTRR